MSHVHRADPGRQFRRVTGAWQSGGEFGSVVD